MIAYIIRYLLATDAPLRQALLHIVNFMWSYHIFVFWQFYIELIIFYFIDFKSSEIHSSFQSYILFHTKYVPIHCYCTKCAPMFMCFEKKMETRFMIFKKSSILKPQIIKYNLTLTNNFIIEKSLNILTNFVWCLKTIKVYILNVSARFINVVFPLDYTRSHDMQFGLSCLTLSDIIAQQ